MHRGLLALSLAAVPMIALACAAPTGDPEAMGEAAQAESAPLTVDFAGCLEVANVGLAPTANIRPLVPSQFTLAGGPDTTPFVVRAVHCDSISIGGDKARSGDILQIGAVLVPPDGDGDINNYTLSYDTSDQKLAKALAAQGVPARFVPRIEESLQVAPDGSGQFRFDVPAPFTPTLRFDGPVGAPSSTSIPFTANWWLASGGTTIKMASSFPQLFTAGNSVVLTVPERSPLADLLGTTRVDDWPALALFDHFPSAHMDVILR